MATKALIFDVFGTLVDWRNEYQPAMEKVRSGQRGFCKLDELHRGNLDIVLERLGWHQVNEATRQQLNLGWHRLEQWADVEQGLARLRQKFVLAPCSNGHIGLMVNLARHNRWHWDAITGAEIARDYKPQAIVYQASAAALGFTPEETMMVAAHSDDLTAAARAGLKTAFISRPDEHGPGLGESVAKSPVDYSATDLMDLATQLGCA